MQWTLGQARARHWVGCIKAFAEKSKRWEQAADFARGFPTEVRIHGLGLAVSMHANDKEAGVQFVLEALADWLIADVNAKQNGSPYRGGAAAPSALLDKIINGTAREYMRAIEEAMAWLEWGRPMLDAKASKNKEKGSAKEANDGTASEGSHVV